MPLVVYLADRPSGFASEQEKRRFLHWLYAALMWARYSGSSESKLNQDLEALKDPRPAREAAREHHRRKRSDSRRGA